MNSKASLPKIKALISHSDAKTVVAIAAVLKKFKDPEGYEIYYQLLTGKRKGGGSIYDGIKDRKSLEKMGVETAIGFAPFGGAATGAYDYFKQNGSSHSELSVTAVSALADDPDPVAEKALVQASFGGKEVVQVTALRALAKRGDPTVVKDIEPAMCSDKSMISYTAAATILHLQNLRAK
jgi:HEAT repeat protein